MVVLANYSIEYNVLFNRKFIVNLVIQFCFLKDVIFLQDAHHFSLTSYMNSIHDILHSSNVVSIVYTFFLCLLQSVYFGCSNSLMTES